MEGTMRLGSWNCTLKKESLCYSIYGSSKINERHRHRYELNNKYLIDLENNNLIAFFYQTKYPDHATAIRKMTRPAKVINFLYRA